MNFRARTQWLSSVGISFLGLLIFGGCAASAADKYAAIATYVHCLERSAAQVDDGTSDVTGIALAVKSMCAPQFNLSVGTYAQGMSFEAYQTLRNRLDAQRLPDAAGAVMQVRASRSRAIPSQLQNSPAPKAPSAGSLQEAATAAINRGDYATALKMLRPLAEQGDATAQNMLGVIYDDGKGVAQDYAEGVKWFRKAAKQGEPTAQFMVGLRYAEGRGITQDYAEAAKWLRLAAAHGEPNAQKVLDDIYSRCPALREPPNSAAPAASVTAGSLQDVYAANRRCDYIAAHRIVRPLAEHGNAKAQDLLGIMYDEGKGVSQDYSEAMKWYRKAADQGDSDAQYDLGGMYRSGQGVPKDYTEAAKWCRKAADQGYLPALGELASDYEYGWGVAKDPAEAARWYRKAADQGDMSAKSSLATLYSHFPDLRRQP